MLKSKENAYRFVVLGLVALVMGLLTALVAVSTASIGNNLSTDVSVANVAGSSFDCNNDNNGDTCNLNSPNQCQNNSDWDCRCVAAPMPNGCGAWRCDIYDPAKCGSGSGGGGNNPPPTTTPGRTGCKLNTTRTITTCGGKCDEGKREVQKCIQDKDPNNGIWSFLQCSVDQTCPVTPTPEPTPEPGQSPVAEDPNACGAGSHWACGRVGDGVAGTCTCVRKSPGSNACICKALEKKATSPSRTPATTTPPTPPTPPQKEEKPYIEGEFCGGGVHCRLGYTCLAPDAPTYVCINSSFFTQSDGEGSQRLTTTQRKFPTEDPSTELDISPDMNIQLGGFCSARGNICAGGTGFCTSPAITWYAVCTSNSLKSN